MNETKLLKDKTIFNNQLKERYLNTLDEGTALYQKYLFFKSSDLEHKYNKDVSNFTPDQLEELLIEFNLTSLSSLTTALSSIKKYIDFAISEGYVKNFFNATYTFDRQSMLKYVNQIVLSNKYINESIYNDLVEKLINAQDQVIFALLWEGAKGEGCEEVSNLKKSDIDFNNNTLHLTKNNGSTRSIKVSNKTMRIIKDAIIEDKYIKNNGENEHTKTKFLPLADTEYVARPGGRKKTGKMLQQSLTLRLKKMATWYGNPYLTPTSIWESGMFNCVEKLKREKNNELEPDDYAKIFKKFGVSEGHYSQVKMKINELT